MTIFLCPECNARLRADEPGSIVACHACANPVAVPAPSSARKPLAEIEAPVRSTKRPGNPWLTATFVLAIVASAHFGLYLLLTVQASSSRDELEREYGGRHALESAVRPDAAPPAGTDAYRNWRRSYDLWLASDEYGRHVDHVTLLRNAFLFSFLVQVGITGWILMRILGKRRRALAAARRAEAGPG